MIPACSGLDIFTFAAKIKRPLILDGAMGTMLRRKYAPQGPLWMSYLNIDAPDAIYKIHRRYIKAGADIITTNTFRTNPAAFPSLKRSTHRDFVKAGVAIALEAAKGAKVLIAGSNPPAEDCYQKERTITSKALASNHRNHIDLLMDSGADFILNETLSHLDEIQIICNHCSKNKIPFIISFYFDEKLRLLSGEKLTEVIKIVKDYAPAAISFNCIKPVVFKKVNLKTLNYNWGAYLNCGTGAQIDDLIKNCILPEDYLSTLKNILPCSPSFVGACCGSTPEHIKKIKEYIDEKH